MMVIGNTHDEAVASADEFIANHGWPPEVVELLKPRMTLGDPDEVGAEIVKLKELGLDGITMNLVAGAPARDDRARRSDLLKALS